MKKTMWILLVLVIVVGLAVVVVSFRSGNIETPQYKVVKIYGEVEIRLYPKMVVAKTALSNASFDASGSNGFRTIAGYIFGGNANNQKIAMTAPVVMNLGDSAAMYFVMPRQYSKLDLPKPNSGDVQILEESEKTLAVISYGGFSSDDKIALHTKELEKILTNNNVQTKGSFLYMGYNSPWDVVDRKNEVAIEVEPSSFSDR